MRRAGSVVVSAVPAGRPALVLTCASVMPCDSKVVKGEITVAPAGARSLPRKGSPVSMLVPPLAIRAAVQPAPKVNRPVVSVLTVTSPASARPLALLSQTTVAPLR